MNKDQSTAIAIQALSALLDKEELLLRFLTLSGLDQNGLKASIQTEEGLSSVLQFFMEHETDLIDLSHELHCKAEDIAAAYNCLQGPVFEMP